MIIGIETADGYIGWNERDYTEEMNIMYAPEYVRIEATGVFDCLKHEIYAWWFYDALTEEVIKSETVEGYWAKEIYHVEVCGEKIVFYCNGSMLDCIDI